MKKKLFRLALVLAILIAASMLYLNKKMEEQKDPYNVSTVLDDKGVKLYKRGFRLLEEQLATYIKEHYSGVSKIEFSPIFVQGGNGQTMFDANIVPVIYDNHGNKAYLGRKVGKHGYASYGLLGDLRLDFNGFDEEVIEIDVDGKFLAITNYKSLPPKAKLTINPSMDENIVALVNAGHLKDVVKSEKGSLKAEVDYNTDIRKGNEWEWR
ncbi:MULTISPECIES: hypothetical protein [unclassified Streptococcus]|uniref:hypothetical protein n=1 Tax=Streptococcus TaxID=1301 RepID=UPI001E331B99|nr:MULTISPECIES: hypothetical protein [unclassified Streptococcus]MCE3592662.1 hypothetical protein [Streptococcus sp. XMC]